MKSVRWAIESFCVGLLKEGGTIAMSSSCASIILRADISALGVGRGWTLGAARVLYLAGTPASFC